MKYQCIFDPGGGTEWYDYEGGWSDWAPYEFDIWEQIDVITLGKFYRFARNGIREPKMKVTFQ